MWKRLISILSAKFFNEPSRAGLESFSDRQVNEAKRLFDAEFYLSKNPVPSPSKIVNPWLHYLTVGWREGFDPSPNFSTNGYLNANPDVQNSGINPLLHFAVYGRIENRYAPAHNHRTQRSDPLPEVPWFMDLGARGRARWKDCPEDLKDDVSFFLDHGYVKLENSVSYEIVLRAKKTFLAHKRQYPALYAEFADQNGFQRRLCNFHMILDAFKDLYTKNARALRLQDYIFGSPAICYSGLTFEAGSEQPLHRDTPYFCTSPEYFYLGVWVALEHVDEENGALEIIDGGHLVQEPDRFEIIRRYYRDDEDIDQFDQRLWEDYQAEVEALCTRAERRRKSLAMSPGDTVIWHPHLPHGGSIIKNPTRSRLSMVNHVIAKGASIGGMKQFFHREDSDSENFTYFDYDGREFIRHPSIGFGHNHEVNATELALTKDFQS